MERILSDSAAKKLARRPPLPVDPDQEIAIKRDVHEFVVSCSASAFASAFRDVVTDPESMFGLIRIRRPAARMGASFEPGERFQGCFSIERAVLGALDERRLAGAQKLASSIFALPLVERAITWVEDTMLSDYAEIEEIAMGPSEYRLRYRYLDGTPIAGSSVFAIEPIGGDPESGPCKVTQVFEYQEINGIALSTFQRFGLKYHDQVVHYQIRQAAERAGAHVLESTIPAAYGALAH